MLLRRFVLLSEVDDQSFLDSWIQWYIFSIESALEHSFCEFCGK
jgi:hypothetical protein